MQDQRSSEADRGSTGRNGGADYTASYDPAFVSDDLVSRFNEDGYLVIKDAISPEIVERVRAAADRIVAEGGHVGRWWGKPETAPRRVEYRGILNLDETFMDLLAPAKVFPLVVKILGSNLHLMSTNIIYQNANQPPFAEGTRAGWHRDIVGPSTDLGYDATPRMAIRAGYYLTDISEPGSGATFFAPGSHKLREPILIEPGADHPEGYVRPDAKPGDAVIWENRTFHSPERNTSPNLRKAVMVQYGYRWLRPVDYLKHPSHLLDRCDPVTRQLLDASDINDDGSMTRMKGSHALTEWAKENGLA